MKHFLIISITLLLSPASYLAGQTIEADKQTSLTIKVTNKTANGTSPVNDEVFVNIYEQGKLIKTLKGIVDSEGKAVFQNVSTGSNITAIPIVKHRNMAFNGHPVSLKQEQTIFNGNVDVFEVSTENSKLSVTTHHLIIKLEADGLRITEYMQLNNSSDMAVTSAEKDDNDKSKVIEVMLPKGFKNLFCSTYFQQNALVVTKDGFYDTMAIPPGRFDAEFSYTLEIDSETIDIVKNVTLPTSEFMIFSILSKGSVKGLGEPAGEVKLADGSSAEYFSFKNLEKGRQIKFQIGGLLVPKSDNSVLIILIVAFALIALLVIWRLIGQKNS